MASVVPARTDSSVPIDAEREARPPAPASKERYYLPELDIVRFAAFLWVFYIHAAVSFPAFDTNGWPQILLAGYFAIDLFFMMSAYVIAQLLARELARRGEINVRAFYVRRMLRTWPLYFFFVALAFVLSISTRRASFASWFAVPPSYFLAFVFFSANFVFARYSSTTFFVNILWTVSIEEQVYLVFPWLIRGATPRAVFSVGAVLIATANLARIHFAYNYSSGVPVWYNTLTHLDAIGIGIVLAAAPRQWFVALPGVARAILLALGVGCWIFAINYYYPMVADEYPLQEVVGYAVGMVGCGIIVAGVLGIFKTDLKHPAMRFLAYAGKISYGLYVYHALAMTLTIIFCSAITRRLPTDSLFVQILRHVAGTSISLSLAFAMAAASYKWLETPFLKLKERFTVVPSRAV